MFLRCGSYGPFVFAGTVQAAADFSFRALASQVRDIQRIERRNQPANLRAYWLLDVSTSERRKLLSLEMERAHKENGGIHIVVVDGAVDLCVDVNDQAEANGLVEELVALAVKYKCPILTVLHENPGVNGSKTRGHLGSQLERKAESNLRIAKDTSGISMIYGEQCRHLHLPREAGPRFKWDDKAGMHVSCEAEAKVKAEATKRHLEDEAREIFRESEAGGIMTWGDVHKRIQQVNGIALSGARKRFQKLIDAGIIRKNSEGHYHL